MTLKHKLKSRRMTKQAVFSKYDNNVSETGFKQELLQVLIVQSIYDKKDLLNKHFIKRTG